MSTLICSAITPIATQCVIQHVLKIRKESAGKVAPVTPCPLVMHQDYRELLSNYPNLDRLYDLRSQAGGFILLGDKMRVDGSYLCHSRSDLAVIERALQPKSKKRRQQKLSGCQLVLRELEINEELPDYVDWRDYTWHDYYSRADIEPTARRQREKSMLPNPVPSPTTHELTAGQRLEAKEAARVLLAYIDKQLPQPIAEELKEYWIPPTFN